MVTAIYYRNLNLPEVVCIFLDVVMKESVSSSCHTQRVEEVRAGGPRIENREAVRRHRVGTAVNPDTRYTGRFFRQECQGFGGRGKFEQGQSTKLAGSVAPGIKLSSMFLQQKSSCLAWFAELGLPGNDPQASLLGLDLCRASVGSSWLQAWPMPIVSSRLALDHPALTPRASRDCAILRRGCPPSTKILKKPNLSTSQPLTSSFQPPKSSQFSVETPKFRSCFHQQPAISAGHQGKEANLSPRAIS
jgi:hypothetical protein